MDWWRELTTDLAAQHRAKMEYAFHRRSCCPACGSASCTRYRAPFNGPPVSDFIAAYYGVDPSPLQAEYRIEECDRCGSFYQAAVAGPDLIELIYDQWVDQVEDPSQIPTHAFDTANPRLSRDGHELMAAASYLGLPLNEMRTLDFGMGFGLWATIARDLGCDSHGTDLSRGRMDMARSRGITTVETLGKYHFINSEQVFEHLTDPLAVMTQLSEALLPGGVLKVSVPSARGVSRLCARLAAGQQHIDPAEIVPIQPLEHVNCYTRAGLSALGQRCGLQPVRPGLWHGYAFLRHRRTVSAARPPKAAKELIRPIYQWMAPNNLYVWLRRAN